MNEKNAFPLEDFFLETVKDPHLLKIQEKIQSGERLSREDGLILLKTRDLHFLSYLAEGVKRVRTGDKVYFVVNCHINPTNLCVLSCKFCSFYARKGDPRGYEMTVEEIFHKIDRVKDRVREIHIVGGHHPDWPFEVYVNLIRILRERYPAVNLKAYTAAEVYYFTRITRRSAEEVLIELKEAGLDTMPGGGAEVFSDRLHKLLFPGKASPKRWLDIHRIAHSLGIRSNATLLFGHIETHEEIVEHLLKLRALQDETGGFLCFVPLSFHPENNELSYIRSSSGVEDLKIVALSRLMLDNFPHIKSYWIQLGERTGQVALHYGADDLDGTIVEEKITHSAGAKTPVGLTCENLIRLIQKAGFLPVERDAYYNELVSYPPSSLSLSPSYLPGNDGFRPEFSQ